MSRTRKFTDEQVEAIRASTKIYKELAVEYGTSVLTIGKIKRKSGAYADLPEIPSPPVLNPHGEIIGFNTDEATQEL